jgi:hypothetical protein
MYNEHNGGLETSTSYVIKREESTMIVKCLCIYWSCKNKEHHPRQTLIKPLQTAHKISTKCSNEWPRDFMDTELNFPSKKMVQ